MKVDNLIIKYNTLVIVPAAVIFYLTLEHLIKIGYSASSVLLYRGILSFVITCLLSLSTKQIILPKNFRLQYLRITVSGTALLLVFQSYKYLEASTVSLISRLDIPFAVLIPFFFGKRKRDFKVILSIIALCLILSVFFYAKHIGEGPIGLTLAIIAVLMTSGSYLLAKRSTKDENNLVVINSVNIGSIVIGIICVLLIGNISQLKIADLWVLLLASLSQISLNYALSTMYRNKEVEEGQRPLLISVLILLFVEQVLHQRLFDSHHSFIVISIVAVIYLITLKKLPLIPFKKNIDSFQERTLGITGKNRNI
jgi:drug/metabolite transporter (DMT)-like permease